MKNNIHEKEISIESTHIMLKSDLNTDIEKIIKIQRQIITDQINKNPSFTGYNATEIITQPRILELMTKAGKIAEIGPMSSVAGSISQVCLEHMMTKDTKFTIIENGGDIALKTEKNIVLGVYAGNSIFSNQIGLKVKAKKNGYGICTSSGTVGPSKSFGKTDATIVFSKSASISDSLATRIGNYGIGNDDDEIVQNALEKAEDYTEYFDGVIVIKGEQLAKIGHIPKIVGIKEKI